MPMFTDSHRQPGMDLWLGTHEYRHTHSHTVSLLPGAGFGATQGLALNLSVLQGISLHFGVHTDPKILKDKETQTDRHRGEKHIQRGNAKRM